MGVKAWWTGQGDETRHLLPSDKALAENGIIRVSLNPREALAVVSGTSMLTGVTALAIHGVLHLASLSQVLKAMYVEALGGTEKGSIHFWLLLGRTGVQRNPRGILIILSAAQNWYFATTATRTPLLDKIAIYFERRHNGSDRSWRT